MRIKSGQGHVRNILVVSILAALFATPLQAHQTVPQNLGYGLDFLVASESALRSSNPPVQLYNGYASEQAALYASRAITDSASGRVLVDITLSGAADVKSVRLALLAKIPSFTVSTMDDSYRGVGMIEGYVAVADAPALAQVAG